MISIICPIYNEERYIVNCVESILAQDIDRKRLELIFVDGMSTDKTRELLQPYLEKYSFIMCLDNPKKIVPIAMNIGIRNAKGNVIVRIDAHSKYEKNYLSTLVNSLYVTGADNVGATCKTDVLNKTPVSLAIKEVLGHPFGVGNSQFRIGADKLLEVDTVPFGCWRRDVFDKYGMYDERLVRNQDIELNKRIIRGGGRILLVPDTFCTYYAREEIWPLMLNNYQNGFWNIKTVYLTNELSSLSLRHFIPLLFVLSLLFPFLALLFYTPLISLALLSISAYSVVALYYSYIIKTKVKGMSIWTLYRVFLSLHLAYGFGSLMGLLMIPFEKKEIDND